MAGPRGDHNREEFLTFVTDVAERIAATEGLRGLGLRKIASAVGYAPNSIYNAIGDLDDVVLRVNARTLDRLRLHLESEIAPGAEAATTILRLAHAYLGFVLAQPRLWTLLFEHMLPEGRASPSWFDAALTRLTAVVDRELEPLLADRMQRNRAVAALWAALHGIASLATSGKLAALSAADPHDLVDLLIGAYLAGTGVPSASRATGDLNVAGEV